MLLMRPRRLARSRNTSCSTPLSTTAARASCVLALMRISVLIGRDDPARLRHRGTPAASSISAVSNSGSPMTPE